MRILLINELFSMGGSEIQTLREKSILQANGHDVWHLTFDSSLNYEIDPTDSQHINLAPLKCETLVDRIKDKFYKWALVDPKYKEKLVQLFEKIQPDIIHVNVNNYKQISLYDALKNYPSVQTIRDFSAVCPSRLCVTQTYETCRGYCYGNCTKECMPQSSIRSKLRFLLMKWNIKRVNQFRLKGIDMNLCPSQYLTNTCCDNGIPTHCLNNSFDFSIVENFEKKINLGHKVYLVYGIVAEHKGIGHIITAFEEFAIGKDVELQIVGKVLDGYKQEFENLLRGKEKVSYLGVMKYTDIIQHLEGVYSVIVPSLWLENYPNTALEGLATRCLVLGSNRGGIPELIADNRFTFDVLDQEDIIKKLEASFNLDEESYLKIVESNYTRIMQNNHLDVYYRRILDVFDTIIDRKDKR